MGGRKQHLAWRQAIMQYACPSCGVAPGQLCITISGQPFREPHAARSALASADHWATDIEGSDDG
jgi:hypothetical protein